MFQKVTKIKTEKFKKLVHEIEQEARVEAKEEFNNMKNKLIETRARYTILQNQNIKLQQENEILKIKLKGNNDKPIDNIEKLENEIYG